VLAHRIMPVARFGLRGVSHEALIASALERIPVPAETIPA